MTYQQVENALRDGADPRMLCETCPWDRNCISPPPMTKGEVNEKIEEARRQDFAEAERARAAGQAPGFPTGTLLTAMTLGGRQSSGAMCPVFVMRLRTKDGRGIVDHLKEHMRSIDVVG